MSTLIRASITPSKAGVFKPVAVGVNGLYGPAMRLYMTPAPCINGWLNAAW